MARSFCVHAPSSGSRLHACVCRVQPTVPRVAVCEQRRVRGGPAGLADRAIRRGWNVLPLLAPVCSCICCCLSVRQDAHRPAGTRCRSRLGRVCVHSVFSYTRMILLHMPKFSFHSEIRLSLVSSCSLSFLLLLSNAALLGCSITRDFYSTLPSISRSP